MTLCSLLYFVNSVAQLALQVVIFPPNAFNIDAVIIITDFKINIILSKC